MELRFLCCVQTHISHCDKTQWMFLLLCDAAGVWGLNSPWQRRRVLFSRNWWAKMNAKEFWKNCVPQATKGNKRQPNCYLYNFWVFVMKCDVWTFFCAQIKMVLNRASNCSFREDWLWSFCEIILCSRIMRQNHHDFLWIEQLKKTH